MDLEQFFSQFDLEGNLGKEKSEEIDNDSSFLFGVFDFEDNAITCAALAEAIEDILSDDDEKLMARVSSYKSAIMFGILKYRSWLECERNVNILKLEGRE